MASEVVESTVAPALSWFRDLVGFKSLICCLFPSSSLSSSPSSATDEKEEGCCGGDDEIPISSTKWTDSSVSVLGNDFCLRTVAVAIVAIVGVVVAAGVVVVGVVVFLFGSTTSK